MAVYSKYSKGYNLFYPSSYKTLIERSVKFEEEPMQETELDKGEFSHSPLHDDVSDDYSSNFSDSDVDDDGDDDMHSYHDSPISPKCTEKTIRGSCDLGGDPLDSRKTRS